MLATATAVLGTSMLQTNKAQSEINREPVAPNSFRARRLCSFS
jgi:hypothetical protein